MDEAAVCATTSYTQPVVAFASGADDVQDLKEYFRRPRLIASGTASNTNIPLVTANITNALLFDTWFPTGRDRLEGVEGVRFTIVATLTVAANPFHGGVLALGYQYGGVSSDLDQFCRLNLAPASTNLPHVRLNVAEETMAQLEIPYIADLDYLVLSSYLTKVIGVLGLSQIVPTPSLTNSPDRKSVV